jgi:hypothetical protein
MSTQGELIFCYACRKQIADNAVNCPRCGAVQTPEGREKGRQIKNQTKFFTRVGLCIMLLPILACFLGVIFSRSGPPPERRGPSSWDMEKLKDDADEVMRDPTKAILVPYDGSQPRVVRPYPSRTSDDPP